MKPKKKTRSLDIRAYIDDDVESGEVKEVGEGDDYEAIEVVKKKTKKEKDAEKAEDDALGDFYELDDEAEAESVDDDETRERLRALVAQQEEEDWKDIEEQANELENEEKEKEEMLKIIAQKNEEKQITEKKAPVVVVKKKNKKKKLELPSQEPEPDFQYDCVWRIGGNQYLVHLIGQDKLGHLTTERYFSGFREKMDKTWNMLYPFSSGKDGLALQQVAPHIKWYEFWIKPLSRLPNLPTRLESFITHEREGALSECCEAFWRIEEGEFFLVHLAFFPCHQRNSMLSIAFHVVAAELCPPLFTAHHRRMIMTPDVVARYPWTNGDDGLALLEANRRDVGLTYQELKKRTLLRV